MIYRYFNWIVNGKYHGTGLYAWDVIQRILQEMQWQYQVFYSIQNFDANGVIQACPIYFDFDAKKGGGLDDVLEEVRDFVQMILQVYNVIPHIHFTGGRGFHVVIPYPIEGPRSHEVLMKMVGSSLFRIYRTLDASIYNSKRFWRVPGSKGSAPGLYKTPLYLKELNTLSMSEIIEKAKTRPEPRTLNECDIAKINEDTVKEQIEWGLKQLPAYNETEGTSTRQLNFETDLTPCLVHMLKYPAGEGDRHNTIFTLGRFFYLCGWDITDTKATLRNYPHWRDYMNESTDVDSTLKSIWRAKKKSPWDVEAHPSTAS